MDKKICFSPRASPIHTSKDGTTIEFNEEVIEETETKVRRSEHIHLGNQGAA